MKTINAAGLAHIARNCSTLAICWRLTRRDGVLILGTEHDKNIAIQPQDSPDQFSGIYPAQAGITGSDIKVSSDLSVDNSEVQGSYNRSLTVTDLRAADIEAGLFDRAAVVVFLVNYNAPDDFQIILGAGTLGDITRQGEGRYITERRGLAEKLRQNFIRTYSVTCNATLGDQRCKIDLDALSINGSVASIATARRAFSANPGDGISANGSLVFGHITFTSGDNAGFSMEIKVHSGDAVELYLPMPEDIQIGDTFTVFPGCDKTQNTCLTRYDNLLNFRGHGFYVPGQNEVLKIGGQERVET